MNDCSQCGQVIFDFERKIPFLRVMVYENNNIIEIRRYYADCCKSTTMSKDDLIRLLEKGTDYLYD